MHLYIQQPPFVKVCLKLDGVITTKQAACTSSTDRPRQQSKQETHAQVHYAACYTAGAVMVTVANTHASLIQQ
jgi:hypothetical protein